MTPAYRRSGPDPVLLVFGVVVLAVCVAVLGLALDSFGVRSALTGAKPAPAAATSPATADAAKDPWPECAVVREYLRTHADDPDSVEIVEWKERAAMSQLHPNFPKDGVSVTLTYRARNKAGAKVLRMGAYVLFDGKVNGDFTQDSELNR